MAVTDEIRGDSASQQTTDVKVHRHDEHAIDQSLSKTAKIVLKKLLAWCGIAS